MTEDEYKIIYAELEDEEGCKLISYRCTANKITVGVGFNCEANKTLPIIGKRIFTVGQSITQRDSDKLLRWSVDKCLIALRKKLPDYNTYPFFARYVLLSLTFNMGAGWMDTFKNTMKAVKAQDWDMVAQELKDSKWYKQVKRRGPKLIDILITQQMP